MCLEFELDFATRIFGQNRRGHQIFLGDRDQNIQIRGIEALKKLAGVTKVAGSA